MAKKAEKLSLRERNKLRTRHEILNATLEVFNREGFSGTSIDKIAEHAGIAKGTAYVYFSDGLDDIYREIYSELSKKLLKTTEEKRRIIADPVERIVAMAETLLELSEIPEYGRFYSLLSPELRPVLRSVVGSASKRFIVFVALDLNEMLNRTHRKKLNIAISELLVGSMGEAARIVSEDSSRKPELIAAFRKVITSIANLTVS